MKITIFTICFYFHIRQGCRKNHLSSEKNKELRLAYVPEFYQKLACLSFPSCFLIVVFYFCIFCSNFIATLLQVTFKPCSHSYFAIRWHTGLVHYSTIQLFLDIAFTPDGNESFDLQPPYATGQCHSSCLASPECLKWLSCFHAMSKM